MITAPSDFLRLIRLSDLNLFPCVFVSTCLHLKKKKRNKNPNVAFLRPIKKDLVPKGIIRLKVSQILQNFSRTKLQMLAEIWLNVLK